MSKAGIAMGVVGIGLIEAALLVGSGELDRIGQGDRASAVALSRDSANEFDPPPGDGAETGTENLAVDGNPGNAWATEHYDTENTGGIKDGVGIYVETDRQVSPAAIEIRTPNDGWDAEIFASNESPPPESLDQWGEPVGGVTDGGNREEIELTAGPATAFLIWFTKLPSSEDEPSRFQMEISEIRLLE
jgi:hypothetical protein